MGPLKDIQKSELMELVNALRAFTSDNAVRPDSKSCDEARRLVEKWDYAFKVWGWNNPDDLPSKASA